MLDICRKRLKEEAVEIRGRVTLVKGDVRDFRLDATFKLVTIPFRPFQHLLTVEEELACLACVKCHLRSGGRLALDVFNPYLEWIVPDSIGKITQEDFPFEVPDGRRVVISHRIADVDM